MNKSGRPIVKRVCVHLFLLCFVNLCSRFIVGFCSQFLLLVYEIKGLQYDKQSYILYSFNISFFAIYSCYVRLNLSKDSK
jgi:hypothetical protein